MSKYDIYDQPVHSGYRYRLGIRGAKKLIIIGLNPSHATKEKSDNTMAKVANVAERNGFSGFVMLNLCPLRDPYHTRLPDSIEPDCLEKNFAVVDEFLVEESDPVIWAAWGGGIVDRRYFVESLASIVNLAAARNAEWKSFGGLTKAGHPRHPSRLSYSWGFDDFDVAKYSQELSQRRRNKR